MGSEKLCKCFTIICNGDLLHDFTKKHDVSPSKNRDFNLRHGDVIMLKNMFFFRDGGIDRMIMKSIMCVVIFFKRGIMIYIIGSYCFYDLVLSQVFFFRTAMNHGEQKT